MRPTLTLLTGCALGALLATAGLVGGGAAGGDTGSPATGPEAPAPVEPAPWVAAGEARFANTILVPTALTADDGEIVLEFDLVPIGSAALRFGDAFPGAVPERWTLRTVDGALIEGATPNSRSRRARFAVPADVDVESVDSLALTAWRIRIPIREEIAISPRAAPAARLADGSSLLIETVLEQANGTTIRFDLEHPPDDFAAGDFGDAPRVTGVGEGWRNAGFTQDGFQLTYTAGDLPQPLRLVAVSTGWHRIEGSVRVPIAEGIRG